MARSSSRRSYHTAGVDDFELFKYNTEIWNLASEEQYEAYDADWGKLILSGRSGAAALNDANGDEAAEIENKKIAAIEFATSHVHGVWVDHLVGNRHHLDTAIEGARRKLSTVLLEHVLGILPPFVPDSAADGMYSFQFQGHGKVQDGSGSEKIMLKTQIIRHETIGRKILQYGGVVTESASYLA